MKVLLLHASPQVDTGLLDALRSLADIHRLTCQPLASGPTPADDMTDWGHHDGLVLWLPDISRQGSDRVRAIAQTPGLPPPLVLAPDLSAEQALQCIAAGALDALAWPCPDQRLQVAVHKLVARQADHARGTPALRLATIPGKGGSGASFVAVNLAYAMATHFHQRTLLIDLDLVFADASFAMTEAQHGLDLVTASQQEHPDAAFAFSACFQVHDKLWLLKSPGSIDAAAHISAASLGALIDLLAPQFDVLIMDLDRRLDACSVQALDRSDKVLQIVLPQIPDLRDAQLQRNHLLDLGVSDAALAWVLNRCGAFGPAEALVRERMVPEPLVGLPHEAESATMSVNAGESILLLSPNCALSRALRALAGTLLQQAPARPPHWIDRARQFLFPGQAP